MKFFKVLPKEKSNLKSACKKISFAIVLKACNFIKKRLQHRCFPVNIPKNFKNNFFYRTTPVDAFEWWSIRKEFLKKKVSGEITFDIITLFNVQIQEPMSRSPTTRAYVFLAKFVEFYYHKIFETRSWWQPKHYMDKCSLWPLYNWRIKDLSMPCDQKVMALLSPMEKCPIKFYHRVAFTTHIW